MKNKRRLWNSSDAIVPQEHDQLQLWASDERSTLIIIRGTFISRSISRELAVSIIEATKATETPVVWILNSGIREENSVSSFQAPSAVDVLKQLVYQVLQLNHTFLNERSVALNAARYKSATTEDEWFDIHGAAIAGLRRIYIIIDIEVVGPDGGNTRSWPKIFTDLFEALLARKTMATVKVVLVSYRTQLSLEQVSRPGVGSVLNLARRGQVVKSGAVNKGKRYFRGGKDKKLNTLKGL
jgi:hypothetical protein